MKECKLCGCILPDDYEENFCACCQDDLNECNLSTDWMEEDEGGSIKLFKVILTSNEIEDLICGCYAQIQEFCCTNEERKPFELLVEKLETVKGGG